MIKKIIYKFANIVSNRISYNIDIINNNIYNNKLLIGRLLSNYVCNNCITNFNAAEFKVFSQWGDDGIIQYLISRIEISNKSFIEFGVDNYLESNTRFLLLNNNWSGLIMDSSEDNIKFIKNDEIYWKHDLTAKYSFVTSDNINGLFTESGFTGEIGLLHIDIDGNDYWIWKAIEVVSPVIVIVEYNSLFGIDRAITVPYQSDFSRFKAHHSGLYAGSSLPALCDLASEKGYAFIGSNSAGNNAYFIRNDRVGSLRQLTAAEGYVAAKFREHRNEQGELTYLPGHEAINSIRGMNMFNTRTNAIEGF